MDAVVPTVGSLEETIAMWGMCREPGSAERSDPKVKRPGAKRSLILSFPSPLCPL